MKKWFYSASTPYGLWFRDGGSSPHTRCLHHSANLTNTRQGRSPTFQPSSSASQPTQAKSWGRAGGRGSGRRVGSKVNCISSSPGRKNFKGPLSCWCWLVYACLVFLLTKVLAPKMLLACSLAACLLLFASSSSLAEKFFCSDHHFLFRRLLWKLVRDKF